ncbi:MAG: hypothetical protein HFH50_00550 [Lachnospiraceae bacterium]|jgi:hypothetical protein|nr:hypothetical protein [Lachnospiraceae bacterium]
MEYIAHRINTVKELKSLPVEYGVELDLRDDLNGRIYIQHNPFEPGEDFEEYLKEYHHGTMILNIKSERIELKILEMLPKYDVKSYFFLDSSFPMIWLLSNQGEKNIALRVSEVEGLDTVRNMAGKVEWIWIDCFRKIPIGKAEADELKELGYKLCFVSPELEGRDEDIEVYKQQIADMGIEMDAVCTKFYNIKRWVSI